MLANTKNQRNIKKINKNLQLRKAFAILLSLALILTIIPPKTVNATDSKETIYINTYEDLVKLSLNCQDDMWSINKNVILMSDIDLSGKELVTISVFNGTFDGNNHTISNFNYVGDGYVTGLFRYVEKDAIIESLTVQGVVTSTGEQECVGAIAGINYGTIRNCNFNGNVNAQKTLGGIVGINEKTGTIKNCTVTGRIAGYYFTGGICGKNHGTILNCVNKSGINDDTSWVIADDEKNSDIISTITDSDEVKIYSGVDTGGIAGFSDGIITRCTNYGKVGYEHTGYNIGGIAGRQSGLMSLCVNNGMVYGRKDIGGIVGQLEPYIEMIEGSNLKEAVNRLHELVNQTIEDMQNTKDVMSKDIETLIDYTDKVLDTTDSITGKLTDFADANMDALSSVTDSFEYVFDNMPEITDEADKLSDNVKQLTDDIIALIDEINVYEQLKNNESDYNKYNVAKDRLEKSMDKLDETINNSESVNKIKDIMTNPDGTDKKFSDLTKEEREQILDELVNLLEHVSDIEEELDDVLSAFNDMYDIVSPYLKDASHDISDIVDRIDKDTQECKNNIDNINANIKDIINYVNAKEELNFTKIDDSISDDKTNLHNQLKQITSTLQSLESNASNYSDKINQDLIAINDQINVIFNLIIDKVDSIENVTNGDIFTDASQEDIENTVTGKVDNCINKGDVIGDINVGGIAGSMAIDDEDLESNAAGSTEISIGNTYITKCIVNNSKNNGFVSAKKNGAGGIVGYEKLGIVNNTISRGSVECQEGDYAGGIVGQSLTIIKNSNALCQVTGDYYVGGIAGFAKTLTNCYSMTQVNATGGKKGSIAGQIDAFEKYDGVTSGIVKDNYFVTNDVKGIDGISYMGMAQEITYDEILKNTELSSDFAHLNVTYRIEDTFLGSEEVKYGEELTKLNFPEIPQKDGYYGEWEDLSGQTMKGNMVIEATYVDVVTVVESEETVLDGEISKPIALIEGQFKKDTKLTLTENTTQKAPSGVDEYIIYDVKVDNANISDVTTKLRIKSLYKNTKIYVLDNSEWKECNSKLQGSYLQTTLEGNAQTYCIATLNKDYTIIVIGVCVLAVIILAIRIVSAKKKATKH